MFRWRSGLAAPKRCQDRDCPEGKLCSLEGDGTCVDPCADQPGTYMCARWQGKNVKSLQCIDIFCQECDKKGNVTNAPDGAGECQFCQGGEMIELACPSPCKR